MLPLTILNQSTEMLMDMSRVTDQTMDLLWVLFAYLTTIVDRKLPSHYCIFFLFH